VRRVSRHPSEGLGAIPHRYPRRLVDRLEALIPGRQGTAWKAISAGEAHGDGDLGLDGLSPALLVDALGQLAIVILADDPPETHTVFYLASIEAMEFGTPAEPGDLVCLEASVLRTFRGSSRVSVSARVGARCIAKGTMVLSTGAGGRVLGAAPAGQAGA
jgi:3-hydroxymyristoyl/3-hydroxydecanoyl-(acyl carrier protein) dehydratase